MKIQLFENTTEHIITIGRKEILDRIVDELFGSNFGLVYSMEDVDIIEFHYKGYPDLEAFLIIIELKFIESEDVMNGITGRMKNIDSKLGFMSVSRLGIFGGNSVFNFWYYLSEEDISKF